MFGWRPAAGKLDKYGKIIEDRIYNLKDYDRSLVLDQRTERVAERTSEYLKATDRFHKTIMFCEDIDHADRMRHAMINKNADLVAENWKYVLRITGDDMLGKTELDNFILPDEKYPVIATTSRLMSTGVDAQTCRVIVLDKNINSMTEFKQIIGRGTRIREDFNKVFFTILDFRNATRLFYDPDFDGDPVQVYEPGPDDPVKPPEPGEDDPDGKGGETELGDHGDGDGDDDDGIIIVDPVEPKQKRIKYYVNDVPVEIVAERVQYYDKDKGLVSVSLKDYSRQNLKKTYGSLDEFLTIWNKADRKEAVIAELAEKGIFLEELKEQVGQDLDPFDLVCHVAFDQPPLTRKERAEQVKKRDVFTKYGEIARLVLDTLLDKYQDEGIEIVESAMDSSQLADFLRVPPFQDLGMPVQILKAFGGKEEYFDAIRDLERQIYLTQ